MLYLMKMKVETDSGVLITIIPEGSSKIILFDKPVRVVELKKEEASQLRSLLTSSLKTKTSVELPSHRSHPRKVMKGSSH